MDDLVEALQKREHYFLNASEGEYDANLLRKARYRIEALTRPTADLGDDGELIAALWSYAHDLKVAVPLRQAMEDARDRLILYREALENIRDESNQVVGRRGGLNPKLSRICEIADALLSRSGDD